MYMAGVVDLLTLALVGGGIYYAISSGMLNQFITPPGLPTEQNISLTDGEMLDIEEINKQEKKKKKKKDKDRDEEEFDDQQFYGPQYQQPQYQGPPPIPTADIYGNPYGQNQLGYPVNRNVLAPPPGAMSSIYPTQIPMTPPYVSSTVNTYSQYSPYNQFSQYQQYQTPQTGYMQTGGDDNIGFTDIDTSKYGCAVCKTRCQQNPYSFICRSCR